ncbi:ABC transporter ATP-binding protein [Dolosigranulum pigrum]|uniref:ABC transporter ATP-binding protein n=1 Tax=Dolosigranulum pigrum TaxID=29394 RepID=UPI001AD89200|nr:ABC transporter ATP-binding protein [Dolosigranulum pigrum]QTJ33917.1 ABC transporter ATP-binding protein [Dolosigranulum pigrum]QTJ39092.1 ABC transporter ATP-binding protein [Dolosigranulum pigrum]QTJ47581.1 ABC transporter ATP-binding protein [Dolosigranulum pigrum]
MNLIKQYIRENKLAYFFSVICAILGVISNLFIYIILSRMIVALIDGGITINYYLHHILWIFACLVIKESVMTLSTMISHATTYHIIRDIRKDLMDKLFKMPLGDILSESSGKLKDIIVNQVDNTETTLAHIIPEMTANILGPIVLFIYMLTLDWRVTLLSLIPLGVGILFMMPPMKRAKVKFPQAVKIGQRMNNIIVEYINGIEVIRAFNQRNKSYTKYSDIVYEKASYHYNWLKENATDYAASLSIAPMGILTIIPFGLYFTMVGSLDGGVLLTLIILSFGTIQHIMKIMMFEDDLGRVSTIFGEIETILSHDDLLHANTPVDIDTYDIHLENVDFSYDGEKKILDQISLKIEEGAVHALVGESGSGKSTIAKLMAGFWDVDNGHITIGGADMQDIPLEALSSLISYVSQDNFLFDISIKDNIRIGKDDASDQDIVEICQKAGCHDFIMNLSNGYDTVAGEGGSHLSGGERQRISIARAMIKDAPIIILDEATSYIDPENEALIQGAISELVEGKTLIIIAHRLNTITDVDTIFVIKNGKLIESGTHTELLEGSSHYNDLWQAALKGADND